MSFPLIQMTSSLTLRWWMRAGGGDVVVVTLDSSLQIMSSSFHNWPLLSIAAVTSHIIGGCDSTLPPFLLHEYDRHHVLPVVLGRLPSPVLLRALGRDSMRKGVSFPSGSYQAGARGLLSCSPGSFPKNVPSKPPTPVYSLVRIGLPSLPTWEDRSRLSGFPGCALTHFSSPQVISEPSLCSILLLEIKVGLSLASMQM